MSDNSDKMCLIKLLLVTCFLTTSTAAVEVENFDELLSKSKLFNEFQNRIAVLEERDLVQQRQILQLTDALADQTQENAILRETIEELRSQLDVKNTFTENSTQSSTLRHAKTDQTTNHRPYGLKRYLKRGVFTRQEEKKTDVAFSSRISPPIQWVGQNETIVFDKVQVNTGNGYNPDNGVFIAPSAGTYVFYSSIKAISDDDVWCRFSVNDVHYNSIFAQNDQGSHMMIIQLRRGDKVCVQNLSDDDYYGIYGNDDSYTTFSGFLLQGTRW